MYFAKNEYSDVIIFIFIFCIKCEKTHTHTNQHSTQQRNHLNVHFVHTLFDIVIWLKHNAAAVVDAAT